MNNEEEQEIMGCLNEWGFQVTAKGSQLSALMDRVYARPFEIAGPTDMADLVRLEDRIRQAGYCVMHEENNLSPSTNTFRILSMTHIAAFKQSTHMLMEQVQSSQEILKGEAGAVGLFDQLQQDSDFFNYLVDTDTLLRKVSNARVYENTMAIRNVFTSCVDFPASIANPNTIESFAPTIISVTGMLR